MKTITAILLLPFLLLSAGCKKNGTTVPKVTQAACIPSSESSTLSNNQNTYEYAYDAKGKITLIKRYIGGPYHILSDSTIVGDKTIVSYTSLDYAFNSRVVTMVFDNSMFDAFPSKATVAIQEGAITHTDVFTYFFFYDSKNRLTKVGEQTDLVIGDYEYDLSISYNDKDNVTGLSYAFTTGPNQVTNIAASGYDDKLNPYTGIKKWYFLMHAGWNNYDPAPVFAALSSNNPLGFTMPDGLKREMSYTYNENGFPTKRINTNSNASGSSTFEETYTYDCK